MKQANTKRIQPSQSSTLQLPLATIAAFQRPCLPRPRRRCHHRPGQHPVCAQPWVFLALREQLGFPPLGSVPQLLCLPLQRVEPAPALSLKPPSCALCWSRSSTSPAPSTTCCVCRTSKTGGLGQRAVQLVAPYTGGRHAPSAAAAPLPLMHRHPRKPRPGRSLQAGQLCGAPAAATTRALSALLRPDGVPVQLCGCGIMQVMGLGHTGRRCHDPAVTLFPEIASFLASA